MSSTLNDVVAVILAGGYGTRIKHLLDGVPKPMASVAGKPFVEWVIRYLRTQGITKAILSTGYLSEVVEQHFQNHPVDGVETICCPEKTPLGTAGGFLNAVHQTKESPFAWLVINGDSLVFTNLVSLKTHLLNSTVSGVIVGLSVNDTSRYGSLVCNQLQNLENFAEKSPGDGTISAGVYLFRNSLIKEFSLSLPLSFENEVFPSLLARGICLRVHTVQAPFLDIGTPDSFVQAEEFILQNYAKLID
ncbi:sugar phosphate nucleotidyltransferase [Nostoc sp. C117]|uniref:sugar phosphate nucleotidyltransferase n=1 Tax=Nostoc sp. C117 TaxID=3349875 RepID=UPI00370D7FCA